MSTFRPWYRTLCSVVVALTLAVTFPTGVRGDDREGDDQRDVTVRCDKGETIGHALKQSSGPLTLKIVGTCNEKRERQP